MTDKRLPRRKNRHMGAQFKKYKPTAMMRTSAGVLASSMRCLEETLQRLEASRASLNKPDGASKMCWICGKAIRLETCATDEHGFAVHEECYVTKVAFANELVPSSKIHDIYGQRTEENADGRRGQRALDRSAKVQSQEF